MPQSPPSGVVAITGGSSGIGRAAAQLFARRGWRVALIARGLPALEAARAELAGRRARVSIHEADVADCDALRAAATAIVAEHGPITAWVNCAGVSVFAKFPEITDAEFRRVTDVTYLGTVNGTRVALEHMRPRDQGTIVQVCSAIGLRGVPLQSAYSGAKYAMRGFSEAVRAELIHERSQVHLTVVYPPSVNTPFYSHATARIDKLPRPPPPIYQPEIVAEAIHFAATHRRRDVLVGAQTVQTALLNAFAPSLADFLLGRLAPRLQNSRNPGIAQARDENLFAASHLPSPTHGPFDAESLSTSLQFWATRNRGTVGTGLALGAAMLALAGRRGR
jgi:short-subunit dehydrogenase